MERPFEPVPLDDRALARASAFARAGHPALQPVLRVDREGGSLWLEPLLGRSPALPLTAAHASALRDALDALHAAGVAHGAVDAEHLAVDDEGSVLLRFVAAPDPTATIDRDRLALARLASP
jgi:serine/threonine-protein kinase